MILYEYPFNERIRTYLRLECLLNRLGQLLPRETALDHHFALAVLFDVLEASNRADLKSDLLKDLERQKQHLAALRGNPAVSEPTLDNVIARLTQAYAALVEQHSKAGDALARNDWLMTIRSRMAIPGGTCAFDLPTYHAWQQQEAARRRSDLQQWTASFIPLSHAVTLLLQLLRETGKRQMVMANAGQFRMTLPRERDMQLLRIKLDPSRELVPEISGNRFMLSIRLLGRLESGQFEPQQADAPLELALCAS